MKHYQQLFLLASVACATAIPTGRDYPGTANTNDANNLRYDLSHASSLVAKEFPEKPSLPTSTSSHQLEPHIRTPPLQPPVSSDAGPPQASVDHGMYQQQPSYFSSSASDHLTTPRQEPEHGSSPVSRIPEFKAHYGYQHVNSAAQFSPIEGWSPYLGGRFRSSRSTPHQYKQATSNLRRFNSDRGEYEPLGSSQSYRQQQPPRSATSTVSQVSTQQGTRSSGNTFSNSLSSHPHLSHASSSHDLNKSYASDDIADSSAPPSSSNQNQNKMGTDGGRPRENRRPELEPPEPPPLPPHVAEFKNRMTDEEIRRAMDVNSKDWTPLTIPSKFGKGNGRPREKRRSKQEPLPPPLPPHVAEFKNRMTDEEIRRAMDVNSKDWTPLVIPSIRPEKERSG